MLLMTHKGFSNLRLSGYILMLKRYHKVLLIFPQNYPIVLSLQITLLRGVCEETHSDSYMNA